MKRIALALFLSLFCVSVQQLAAEPITWKIQQITVSQVLHLYAGLSGRELEIASSVKKIRTGITIDTPKTPVEKAEALKIIEEALLAQAGVVITVFDDKRASVGLKKIKIKSSSIKTQSLRGPAPDTVGPNSEAACLHGLDGVTIIPTWFIQLFGVLFLSGLCFVSFHRDSALFVTGRIKLYHPVVE